VILLNCVWVGFYTTRNLLMSVDTYTMSCSRVSVTLTYTRSKFKNSGERVINSDTNVGFRLLSIKKVLATGYRVRNFMTSFTVNALSTKQSVLLRF